MPYMLCNFRIFAQLINDTAMATVKAFIRTTIKGKPVKVRIRLSDGRNTSYFGVTNVEVLPEHWNATTEGIKPRILLPGTLSREAVNESVSEAKRLVLSHYSSNKANLSDDWINQLFGTPALKQNVPAVGLTDASATFFDVYSLYVEKIQVSEVRLTKVRGVKLKLQRFVAVTDTVLDIVNLESETIDAFVTFLQEEYLLQDNHPAVYADIKHRVVKRSKNTIGDILKVFSAFMHWARARKLTKANPFETYPIAQAVYGDPIPLLPEEVDKIYTYTPLPSHLHHVRDLFCLQCYLGCRVSDFMALTKANLQDATIIYIAHKTLGGTPVTVYVPLVPRAQAILKKYEALEDRLFPYMKTDSNTGYNAQIKNLCQFLKLTRPVAVLNPLTREPEIKRLCDVVTTHTARKTFINSNYIETQDPKMISKMTGHSENSKAFSRYRNIDIDMLRKQVNKAFSEK